MCFELGFWMRATHILCITAKTLSNQFQESKLNKKALQSVKYLYAGNAYNAHAAFRIA